MDVQTLLTGSGFALDQVALALHNPGTPRGQDALALLAEHEPALFEAYQATHAARPEATLRQRPVLASFIARRDATLVFAGLYRVAGWEHRSAAALDADPAMQAMLAHMDPGFTYAAEAQRTGRDGCALFDLHPLSELADLRGRLLVAAPPGRTYMRRAETTPLPILAITRVPDLNPPMPDWRDLVLDTATLRALPARWAESLRHWRGIYLILDTTDGARYVGAAYGEENLLGRWRDHVAGDTGVTRELAHRDPAHFRFSILELLSPAAPVEEVTRAEQQWMRRLHTKDHGLNS